MSREDPTGRSQGLGKPKSFKMYYFFFKSVSAEKLPGPLWTGEGPLESASELVFWGPLLRRPTSGAGGTQWGCPQALPLWGHGSGRGRLPGRTPARARTHRVAAAQAQRQALQAGLAVGQPAPAQLGQHGEGAAFTRLEAQAPTQSSSAPSPPRPPCSARPKPGWSPGGLGAGSPHLGQHVVAVPMHSVLLLVERGDVGAAQHRAGPRTWRLLAGPAASRAGAESREAPRACWAPGTAPTQLAGRQQSRPGPPASPHRLEPLGACPESCWPLPRAPGGSRPVAPGHSPQGAAQERPAQADLGSRGQGLGSYQFVQPVE